MTRFEAASDRMLDTFCRVSFWLYAYIPEHVAGTESWPPKPKSQSRAIHDGNGWGQGKMTAVSAYP